MACFNRGAGRRRGANGVDDPCHQSVQQEIHHPPGFRRGGSVSCWGGRNADGTAIWSARQPPCENRGRERLEIGFAGESGVDAIQSSCGRQQHRGGVADLARRVGRPSAQQAHPSCAFRRLFSTPSGKMTRI